MGAARPIFWRDMGTFDVECLHGAAFRQAFAGVGEVAETAEHVIGRVGDHGRKEAGHTGREQELDGTGDFRERGVRGVEVHAGRTVHLKVDPSRGHVHRDGLLHRRHLLNGFAEDYL